MLVLSPLILAVSIMIKSHDGGPVFYRARRTGMNGQPFRLLKFRTMKVGADKQGPAITSGGDSRVTPVGRWLRRTKVDELPQLFNVLKGDMSLVGPRPEDPRYVAMYTPEQRRVLLVRPGMTSPASLTFRDEESLLTGPDWEARYVNDVMPKKLQIDLDYLRRRSGWSDAAVVFRTLATLFRR